MDNKNDEQEWQESVADVVLPQWLTDCLPDKPPTRLIRRAENGETFDIVDAEGSLVDGGFATVEDAYDTVDRSDEKFEVKIADDPTVGKIGGMVFHQNEKDENRRMLFTDSYMNSLSLLKSDYKRWVEVTHPRWLSNPNNWIVAYNWLEDHPVFWSRYDKEKTVRWETSNGLSANYVMVGFDEAGNPSVGMEHGPHHAPDFVEHSHDTRTEVYAENFEAAYVALAKSFHMVYDKDGNDRCNEENQWDCNDYTDEPCEKHAHIFATLKEQADDPNWAVLVEQLWAASDAS